MHVSAVIAQVAFEVHVVATLATCRFADVLWFATVTICDELAPTAETNVIEAGVMRLAPGWPIVVVAVAESLVPLGSGVAPEDAVATFVAIPVDAAAMVNAHENAAPLGSGSGPLQSKNFPPTLTLGVAPPVVAPATIEALFNAGGIGSWMTGSVDEFGPRFVAVSVYVRRSPTLAAALSTAFIAERSAEACTQLPVIETT